MMETAGETRTAELAVPGTEPGLSPETIAALEAAVPPNTQRAYRSDWRAFTAWCARTGRNPLPATAETLTEYTRYQAYEWVPERHAWKYEPGDGRPRGLAPTSIERSRAAVIKMHRLAGEEPPEADGAVLILRGYRAHLAEHRDSRARVTKATAMTAGMLRQLTGGIGDTTMKGLRDLAMFLLAYSTATRSVELVRLNIEDITITSEGLQVAVYRPKTRLYDDVAIPVAHAPVAVKAVTAWIQALASAGRARGPLFTRIHKGGEVGYRISRRDGNNGDPEGRIAQEQVTRILRRQAALAGLEGNFSSHSFRRGLATESHRAGNSRKVIAAQGGWDPDGRSLTGYIEEADKWIDNALKGAGV